MDEKESWRKLLLIFGWKTNQIETKIKFTYSQRRVGNLQYCKREKQKRHIINFMISMIFLVNSLKGQKDSFKKPQCGPKILPSNPPKTQQICM